MEKEITEQELREASSAEPQNSNSEPATSQTQAEIEKLVDNDLKVIRMLMSMELVDREKGQNLMKQVIKNAYTSITKQRGNNSQATTQPTITDVFEEFSASNPNFFTQSGRKDVLNYLKNSKTNFDKDELLQISKLIEQVENSAVDRYLKKLEYGKSLNDENTIAKQRLNANAQNSTTADNNRIFTRAQIGKMTADEFTKYEAQIMEQLRKGLIK